MKDFKLDNNPKLESGFVFPDNYFETLSENVLNKLPIDEPKVISIWKKNKKWIYSSAAIVTLSFGTLFLTNSQMKDESNVAEIENYLTYDTSISDDDIIELLDIEDIEKIEISNNIDNKELEEALSNDDNLEQYITN